ncbi:unnamed protein product [Rotaria sp. Silwood2]|nr:unnamed protein product [Rotaria sp. Silwood2]CAF2852556.1 unnamed protein product [Rotaria sp. Silwood2]CAF3127702.1 unnamed protein product [Rotaria sp. Silwood2]CAF3257951.1 unnamed protein product [Rotaria sp. Silwood2]CAF4404116.1 unnamed protein product [Rotaria sp. Silwood2]
METSRGKPIFEHQGYIYIVNKKSNNNKIIWCCRNYRHNQCHGRLHTIDGQVVLAVGEHNHEPSHLVGDVIASRTKMIDAAKQTGHSTHDIVADCVSRLSDHAISTLPNLQHIKRIVQRIRQRHQNPLSLPTNHDSLLIDTQYIKTARGRTFLQFDSGLKKEQCYVDAQIIQAEAGVRQARRREQIRRETRILNLLNEPTTTNFEKVMAPAQNITLKDS